MPSDTLSDIQSQIFRHDAALTRIGSDLDGVKTDLHEIRGEVHETRIVLRERDHNSAWIKGVAASLVLLGVTNLGAGSWWASKTSTSVDQLSRQVNDIELRLRQAEKNEYLRGNNG